MLVTNQSSLVGRHDAENNFAEMTHVVLKRRFVLKNSEIKMYVSIFADLANICFIMRCVARKPLHLAICGCMGFL